MIPAHLVRFHRQAGISLIEVIIAISILAILAAMGIPSYRAWVQNTKIRTSAESILNGLQLARSEAVRRNATVQFALGANSAWTVGCPAAVLTNPPGCPALIQSRDVGDVGTSTIVMTPTPAGDTTVWFTNLGSVAAPPMVPAAPVPFTQINVTVNSANLSSDTRQLNVTLSLGGNAKMCDPSTHLSASDPRKC